MLTISTKEFNYNNKKLLSLERESSVNPLSFKIFHNNSYYEKLKNKLAIIKMNDNVVSAQNMINNINA